MSTVGTSISSAECQALLGALPDAILTCGTDGTVEYLNRAAERLTRQTAEDAVGLRVEEVLPLCKEGSGTPVESPAWECLRREESVGPFVATLSSSADKSARLLEVSAAPIRESGEPISGVILLARDVTRERELTRQMSHRATHDALTGLLNRDEFERRLARALESAGSCGARHALGFLDLDGFKRINDSCGHLAGDSLLRELSAVRAAVSAGGIPSPASVETSSGSCWNTVPRSAQCTSLSRSEKTSATIGLSAGLRPTR